MKDKAKVIKPDGSWMDFRQGPYQHVLKATAFSWVSLLQARERGSRVFGLDTKALDEAYIRAIQALPQLPMEWGSGHHRFDRSRWRCAKVVPGILAAVHCEHPWSKRRTRTLIEEVIVYGNDVQLDALVEAVAIILDARQDTVLLPTQKVTDWGVLSEQKADGLAGRYKPGVVAGDLALIDRATGERLGPKDLDKLEAEHASRIQKAKEIAKGGCP